MSQFTFAHRFDQVSGSAIREIFKVIAQPGMISFAGGNVGANVKGEKVCDHMFMCGPIPVFISFDAISQKWQEIYHFVCEFPRYVFILTGSVKWGIDRQIRPLLENFPFLYFFI